MPDWVTDPRTILAGIAAMAGVGYWVGQINSDRKSFKEFMREVRDDIKTILNRLPPEPTAKGSSPMHLTDFGERIAKHIDTHGWAEDMAEQVMDGNVLLNLQPFKIEAFCDSYVEEQYEQESTVRDMLDNAIYEFGINKDQAFPVLRIPLREALLKRSAALQESAST